SHHLMIFRRTTASFSHKSMCMTIVDHYHCIILICKITDFIQLSHISIHGKYPIGHNYSIALGLCTLKLLFQILHVVVLVPVAGSLAEAHPIDDGGMIQ